MTVLAVTALLLAALPASATSYRYWSFWQGSGSGGSSGWSYQQAGPNTFRPADGSVDGWRFGVSADSSNAARPRTAPDFAAVCGGTAPVAGKKRVAVVIDYGTASDAPSGSTPPAERTACAVLNPDDSSAQLLAQLSPPLRYDGNGILCAISGYPRTGCGEVVADGAKASAPAATGATAGGPATAAPADDSTAATVGWVAGGALIVTIGAAGYWQSRRRRADR